MTIQTVTRITILACAVFLGPARAQDAAMVAEQFPPGSVTSEEGARAALEAVNTARADVQARFARDEAACYDRFFVNHCIDEAKERRREALESLDAIEIEAERFERGLRAQKRDADMIERRQRAAENAEQAAAVEVPPVREPRSGPLGPQGDPRAPKERRLPPTPEQERARERERAENEAAYARKVQEVKERKEAVARRKAEKEARALARDGKGGVPN